MFKGEKTEGIEFYKLLFESSEFTSELGKITLASCKPETELILFYLRKNISNKSLTKSTLGKLIQIGERNELLDENLLEALKQILRERNYFTHNIYLLLNGNIKETIFPKEDLLDTDVISYQIMASDLKESLLNISEVIKSKN
ncbi:hypothetical protein [Wenyingzhuangia sp. IMCC45467]